MRVGVDIDGVLYDFAGALRDYLHHIAGWDMLQVCHDHPEPERWEFYEDWGMTLHEFVQHCHNGVDAGWIFWKGRSFPGARAALQTLRDEGHTIVLITDRHFGGPGQSELATRAWLAGKDMPYDELHVTADKTTVQVDFHIDDKWENYKAMRGAGVGAYLLRRPWNSLYLPDHAVDSLEEYVALITLNHASPKVTVPADLLMDALPVGNIARPGGVRVSKQAPQRPVKAPLSASQGEVRVTASTGGQKGRKLARFDLLPPALWQVAELYGRGAEKYDEWNWRKGYEWSLSYAALQRHANLFWAGEDYDQETGCAHMASVAFHALALLTFMEEHPELDDRFKRT